MSKFVHVRLLGEDREDPIDLSQCSRFQVSIPDYPVPFSDDHYVYYLTDGRWIRQYVDWSEIDGSSCIKYRQEHPINVTYGFLIHRKTLPTELEQHRAIASDRDRYRRWSMDPTSEKDPDYIPSQPKWEKEDRILYYGPDVCHEFRRPALNQFAILNAFQERGWKQDVTVSLSNYTLGQTIKDLNRSIGHNGLIRFRKIRTKVGWQPNPGVRKEIR